MKSRNERFFASRRSEAGFGRMFEQMRYSYSLKHGIESTRRRVWVRPGLLLVFVTVCSISARAQERIKLVSDATESWALIEAAAASSHVLFCNLASGDSGVMFEASAASLPAGRYRLHAPMAMTPLGDPRTDGVEIEMRCRDMVRRIVSREFAEQGCFQDFALDVVVAAGSSPAFSITWSVPDEAVRAKRAVLLQGPPPTAPQPDLGDKSDDFPDGSLAALLGIDAGRLDAMDIQQVECRLMAAGIHIEPLSPVSVRTIRTDRIRYRPGEKGLATVALQNAASSAVKALLAESEVSAVAALGRE